MDVEISVLRRSENEVISYIKNRLGKRWKITEEEIYKKWIYPALNNINFPYIFIARINDKFVGKIFLFIEPNGYLNIKNKPWITALYVKKKFRGNNIGKKLIQFAKKIAADHGYKKIYLDTAVSKDYYEHMGGWDTIGIDFWVEGKEEVTIMSSDT